MPGVEYVSAKDIHIERKLVKKPLPSGHCHRTYELYYMVKGQREYFIEDRFFMVEEGDFVVIPWGVFHRTDGVGGLRYVVHFSGDFLRKFFTGETVTGLLEKVPFVFRGEAPVREQLVSVLSAMLKDYEQAEEAQQPQDELKLSGYVHQLLSTLAYAPNTYVPHVYTDERITKIIQYINENYNHITDIDQIAEHFFISKYHLCRYFRKNLGVSLVAYLNTVKVSQACSMMKRGISNMSQIAMECGFNSSSYFCKVFKKERGISPTEYQKKHRWKTA